MPTLTIQLPGLPPVDHILRDESMTIGRMKGNTIALDDASVSLSHAKITRKDVDFYVKDLNSTNGTMLNGQTIVEARLRDGDQIKFGEVIAHFRSEPAFVPIGSPTAAPAPAAASATPAQPSAPVPPAPAPAPAPTAATLLVPKRLATQAPASAPAAAPAPTSDTSMARSRRSKKAKGSPLMTVFGIAAALVVFGVLAWIFFGKNPSTTTTTPPPAAQQPQPAKKNLPVNETSPGQTLLDLKKSLKSPDVAERRRAAAALHSLGAGAKDAVPELHEALKDSDSEVQMWSALALINNKVYDKATVPILLQVLHHENSMLRQVSCLSLALIPYDEAEKQSVVNALLDVSNKDSDDEVRRAAISAVKIIAPDLAPAEK